MHARPTDSSPPLVPSSPIVRSLRVGLDHVSLPADGPVSASDVVDYARRISFTTFAPAGYVSGAPLHGIVPPAPQQEHFHASSLSRHAAEVKARDEARAAREKVAAEAREAAMTGEAPPVETIIKLLSAWRPGQPWPAGVPPPPGWRPGDPLTIGSTPDRPPKASEGQGQGQGQGQGGAVPAADGAAAGGAERRGPVKVVPFIQLDLNPDMEDAGDDFGSDEFEEVSGSDNDSDSD